MLAHPTTGGVAASFAALGDVIIAEPGALLSFSGPRVVKQTTRESLPDDFGLAESNFRHGHVDLIVPRPELRDTIARVVALLAGGTPYRPPSLVGEHRPGRRDRAGALGHAPPRERREPVPQRRRRCRRLSGRSGSGSSAAAAPSATPGMRSSSPGTRTGRTRSTTSTASATTSSSCTATAPRATIPAIVAGIGSFRGQSVAFVGHQKGRDLKQRTYRNFGMPSPEGYRKAMRVFALAGRLGFPVVTLIDTPGAAPGVGAEQRGQSGAIARSQLTLMRLPVPVVACVIGEGSSGGALAIGVADRVLMQQNAVYTVISPEGCAAILWKDAGEAKRAAAALRPDGRGLPRARRRRRDRARAVRRRAPRPRPGRGAARRTRSSSSSRCSRRCRRTQRRAGRRAKFRGMGAYQE